MIRQLVTTSKSSSSENILDTLSLSIIFFCCNSRNSFYKEHVLHLTSLYAMHRLWAHLVMAYVFTAWVCFILFVEYKSIAALRLKFLSDENRRPDQFTVSNFTSLYISYPHLCRGGAKMVKNYVLSVKMFNKYLYILSHGSSLGHQIYVEHWSLIKTVLLQQLSLRYLYSCRAGFCVTQIRSYMYRIED